MPNNTTPRPERKPSIPHCKYKRSAAKRTRDAFAQLCALLGREWTGICAMNLGVKSGTGVIDDVLISQLRQLASTVHMLAVTDAKASTVLVKAASKLSTQQFQNLQVGCCWGAMTEEEPVNAQHLLFLQAKRQGLLPYLPS